MRVDEGKSLLPSRSVLASTGSLRLLHAEDDSNDALLCQIQIKEAGLDIQVDVVASKEEFLSALDANLYDIVLTDYKMAGWSGMEVLRLLEADGRDIPCILVTGSVGEEIAAKCIKQGATDYILKDRPARLPFAITSALDEKRQREERREAERSRNRLASIVESSLDAIIGVSVSGLIVDWNPGAALMFGYSAGEICGTPLSNLFSDDAFAANTETAIQRMETQGAKRTGDMMDLAVTISAVWNSDGTAVGSSAIIRDITEEKRRQKEFLTTQKLEAMGQLAGGVAHDFNNLLTVINGYARMLLRKGAADPAKLEAILQAGERGQRLTKQLLVFSRKQITQFRTLNFNVLLTGFLDMLRPLIGEDIDLRTLLDPQLAPVMADAGQIEQVVMNLVVNARDAMPGGGTITIRTRNLDTGEVALSVADTGTGMSPEVQARIFEPFFTTKEVGRGTGLGLSTSYGIVNRSNGKLLVESRLGAGTEFTLQFPACASSETESPAAVAPQEAELAPASATILLAEDDPTVREFALTILRDRGYQVLPAENGAKALELCASHPGPIQALVTDVVMPEVNGRTLAERARLLRPNLKVLFVSGYIDRGLKDEDISLPACAFLEKPFTADALLKVVGEFCQGGEHGGN